MMANPSEKAPDFARVLNKMFGRTDAIVNNVCIPEPVGCGGPATEFRNSLSQREYTISGLCQRCQDEIFGK